MSSIKPQYKIRFFYDWGCSDPFWNSNEAAKAKFGVGAISPGLLGLSHRTTEKIYALAEWHDTALNWDYPPHPGPWRQEECDSFKAAIEALLEDIHAELSEEYELIDEQCRPDEDPDLDRYLADPQGFKG